MKYLNLYEELSLNSSEEIFEYLIDTNKLTIRGYNFYVDWGKVENNLSNIEIYLNIMNTLIGKDNIKEEFINILTKYPEVANTIPILLAVRDHNLLILDNDIELEYNFDKESYTREELEHLYYFFRKSGLESLIQDKTVKNLVDYVFGVEVGLDSNARKNRSGKSMENIVENHIKSLCKDRFEYIEQATAARIEKRFNKYIPTDKSSRRFDFAINDKLTRKIWLIEVNYYGSGGSKLKSVAGEFQNLSHLVKTKEDVGFIWITDGKGWNTAKLPLLEAFNELDYVFNLELLRKGALEEVIKGYD